MLLLICVLGLWPGIPAEAQTAATRVSGTVVDARGNPVRGAEILDGRGKLLATSAANGSFLLPAGSGPITVMARHYAPVTVPIAGEGEAGGPLRVVLDRPLESVTVTAYRSPLASGDSPTSTRILDQKQLQQSAAPVLDGKLHQVPGFTLFRRSSSLVANPTTEGVSLRGLGSTAASRSLVVFDGVPLNDPFGGWVHWEELPSTAIQSVEVARGGASDLYGSSAIGGVINIIPVRPRWTSLELVSSYGSEATTESSALGTLRAGPWTAMASGGLIATDGYTLVAPDQRGPIDQPSNVHAPSGLVEINRFFGPDRRLFLRGNVLDGYRHNGTPLQVNSTRLWRYAAGADWTQWTLRLYGDTEHFYQTFSSVAPDRASEKLVLAIKVPAEELGASGQWHQPLSTHLLLLAGADIHDVRAADREDVAVNPGSFRNTTARQRQSGGYGEALYTPAHWTVAGSARVDHFSSFDTVQRTNTGSTPLPSFSQTVFDPRVGVTRRINSWFALNASAFRAFRAPTINELYRSFRVGNEMTLSNPNLRSERATGWETGFQTDFARYGSGLRASYFWTRINGPISAVTLSETPAEVLLQRENLGSIESRGISVDFASLPAPWLAVEGGYQYADATVISSPQEPQLVGKWIPQVARNMATTQVRFSRPEIGLISFQSQVSGRQYDDDVNNFLLHGFFRLDIYASRQIGRHVDTFVTVENLFDRAIEVGKTPQTTLGTPRVVRGGLRISFGG